MKTDTVIELSDKSKYLLLLESELTEERYFLAVLLDKESEPTNTYVIFKEIEKDGKILAKKIDDPLILNELLVDYKNQYEDMSN